MQRRKPRAPDKCGLCPRFKEAAQEADSASGGFFLPIPALAAVRRLVCEFQEKSVLPLFI